MPLPFALRIPIANWWTVGIVGALALAAVCGAVAWQTRTWRRFALGVLGALLGVVTVGAAVNTHVLYVRYLDALWGRYAADQAPSSILTSTTVPDHGVVVSLHVPNPASGFDARDAKVYLPPAWFRRPRPRLPVLMLLHGEPGSPADWTRCCLADVTADRFARAHGGVAPILVMPDINGDFTGDTECVDGAQGNAETYLTRDVRSWVIRRFGARSDARSWALGGFSEGGMCALVLSLRHPDLFLTFLDSEGLAGPKEGHTVDELFQGNQAAYLAHVAQRLLRERRFPGMGGWFEVGADDEGPLAAAREVVPLARAGGIETCLVLVPGEGHTGAVWTRALEDSFAWIAARLGLTRQTAAMTAACVPEPG